MKWQTLYALVKDVVLTGTGIGIIIWQMHDPGPYTEVFVGAAVSMAVPAAVTHIFNVLSGPRRGPGQSSEPAPPPRPSPSSSPAGQHEQP